MSYRILIVDDQKDICLLLKGLLEDEGYVVQVAHDSTDALNKLHEYLPHLVLLDIWLNDNRFDGIELLDVIRQSFEESLVIMMSGHASIETAVQALQKGAYDFLEKPFETNRLMATLRRGVEQLTLRQEIEELKHQAMSPKDLEGSSPQINGVLKLIDRLGKTDSRIMILGEPGVGKTLLARALHRASPRATQPFVTVNCASLTLENMSQELFGVHQNPGQSTARIKVGLFEKASAGTLFLDDVSDLSLEVQACLLGALQSKKFQRLGGDQWVQSDARIISATSKPLAPLIKDGLFRQDLYYRLNVAEIQIPPLRERRSDISILAHTCLERLARRHGRAVLKISSDAMYALESYSWPGNVRQLENVMEWAFIMSGEDATSISCANLPKDLVSSSDAGGGSFMDMALLMNLPLREARESFERLYVRDRIVRNNGNIARTATEIGMDRTALHRKIKQLGIIEGNGFHIVDKAEIAS